MKTTVSVRGQTVVPRKIREQMNIGPQTVLDWQIKDGMIVVYPLPPDPVRAAVGILKGQGPTTDELLAERRRERQRERARERA